MLQGKLNNDVEWRLGQFIMRLSDHTCFMIALTNHDQTCGGYKIEVRRHVDDRIVTYIRELDLFTLERCETSIDIEHYFEELLRDFRNDFVKE